jgi:hypothetical protein
MSVGLVDCEVVVTTGRAEFVLPYYQPEDPLATAPSPRSLESTVTASPRPGRRAAPYASVQTILLPAAIPSTSDLLLRPYDHLWLSAKGEARQLLRHLRRPSMLDRLAMVGGGERWQRLCAQYESPLHRALCVALGLPAAVAVTRRYALRLWSGGLCRRPPIHPCHAARLPRVWLSYGHSPPPYCRLVLVSLVYEGLPLNAVVSRAVASTATLDRAPPPHYGPVLALRCDVDWSDFRAASVPELVTFFRQCEARYASFDQSEFLQSGWWPTRYAEVAAIDAPDPEVFFCLLLPVGCVCHWQCAHVAVSGVNDLACTQKFSVGCRLPHRLL